MSYEVLLHNGVISIYTNSLRFLHVKNYVMISCAVSLNGDEAMKFVGRKYTVYSVYRTYLHCIG
jgi:hypothetical protein